jgi:hypothetical protein
LLRIPNSHNRKAQSIGETAMEIPKCIGKKTLAVITIFGKEMNLSKKVNRVKRGMVFSVLGITRRKLM